MNLVFMNQETLANHGKLLHQKGSFLKVFIDERGSAAICIDLEKWVIISLSAFYLLKYSAVRKRRTLAGLCFRNCWS